MKTFNEIMKLIAPPYKDGPTITLSVTGADIWGRGGTRKIANIPEQCTHPDHNRSSHQVLTPGVYEHICPGCGKRRVFTVYPVY